MKQGTAPPPPLSPLEKARAQARRAGDVYSAAHRRHEATVWQITGLPGHDPRPEVNVALQAYHAALEHAADTERQEIEGTRAEYKRLEAEAIRLSDEASAAEMVQRIPAEDCERLHITEHGLIEALTRSERLLIHARYAEHYSWQQINASVFIPTEHVSRQKATQQLQQWEAEVLSKLAAFASKEKST